MVGVVCVSGMVGVVGAVFVVSVVICGKFVVICGITNSAISLPIWLKFSQYGRFGMCVMFGRCSRCGIGGRCGNCCKTLT